MEQQIEAILSGSKTVAVVGISDKPDRPSHVVAKYLQERGYRVHPVNPLVTEVLGEKAYKSPAEIPERVAPADGCRKPEVGPTTAHGAGRRRVSAFGVLPVRVIAPSATRGAASPDMIGAQISETRTPALSPTSTRPSSRAARDSRADARGGGP